MCMHTMPIIVPIRFPCEKIIGLIFGFLGYRVRHVEEEEYLLPVGEVAEGRTTESINEEAGVKKKEKRLLIAQQPKH